MKYPFATHRVNKNEMVKFLSECINDQKPGNKKRIRAAIDYAKTKNRIKVKVNNDGRYVIAAEFFNWAIGKWPELEKIEELPLPKKRVDKHTIVSAQETNLALGVHAAVISRDYDELRKQFSECLEKLRDCESEKENLRSRVQKQNEELVELRAYKKHRIETNRANARKKRGV
jgi:hypothetical protein